MAADTQIDDRLGRAVFAVNLTGRPPRDVREGMAFLQDSVERHLSARATFRAPADSLHLSVFQFVSARDADARIKEAAWRKRRNDILPQLERAFAAPAHIVLQEPRLEVRPAAIILVFPPSPDLEALRTRISAIPAISGLQSRMPRLQHVTLFRYCAEIALDELQRTCRDIELEIPTWHMTEVDLIRETVYPCLSFELLGRFVLSDEPAGLVDEK